MTPTPTTGPSNAFVLVVSNTLLFNFTLVLLTFNSHLWIKNGLISEIFLTDILFDIICIECVVMAGAKVSIEMCAVFVGFVFEVYDGCVCVWTGSISLIAVLCEELNSDLDYFLFLAVL